MINGELPLVSIVTPCRNAEKYIEDCMMSIRAQDYPRVEHVIVDGKSTDNTVSLIRKYEGEYNLRWISEEDKSPTEATNKGARTSIGSIIGMLPADDLYLPWTIRKVVEKFSERPDSDLVYGDLIQVAYGKDYGTLYFNPPEAELDTHLRFNSIGAMAVFFKRRVFDSLNGFDEDLPIVGDYDFWLRALQRFKFTRVNEALACFRYRANSSSIGNMVAHNAERGILQRRYGVYPNMTFECVQYYSRRVFTILRWLIALLGVLNQTRHESAPWAHLTGSNCLSPMRLGAATILAPLASTNNIFQRRIGFGYVKMEKLIQSIQKNVAIGQTAKSQVSRTASAKIPGATGDPANCLQSTGDDPAALTQLLRRFSFEHRHGVMTTSS